jgi:alginate O-acetyltransferase complex protein AlgI
MIFNSVGFLFFFPLVTIAYFSFPHRYRWILLLLASCFFYMSFIPIYILILFLTISVDYVAALYIERSNGRKRKFFFILSIISTCAILFVFKYFNFFNQNLSPLAKFLHWNYPVQTLNLILPIGLSFHTFQSLSYVIEVYYRRQKAEHHFGIYALYVMFYPQLVAGPIERPQNLLPQFHEKHEADYENITNGLKLMLWGFFQKTVVADKLAVYVSQVYGAPTAFTSLTLLIATFFFAFQIYCDFAGYSNIAIGAAQVMGFRLMKNFDRPYFADSITEFWRRWHISLSTWMRDYIYIPLGGNRVSKNSWRLNILITFLVSGLWHGANWTYLAWGALHGFFILFSHSTKKLRDKLTELSRLSRFPLLHQTMKIIFTFCLVCISWIFFRAQSLKDAIYILSHLFSRNAEISIVDSFTFFDYILAFMGIAIVLIIDVLKQKGSVRESLAVQPFWIRWSLYYSLSLVILIFGEFGMKQFIYFQF